MTEDFTRLSEGSMALDGAVGRCGRCGRNGVVQQAPGAPASCVHVAESTLLCDGMLVEPTDCCELPIA